MRLNFNASGQARRQDLVAGGATFLKYNIGCIQKPGGQMLNGGPGTTSLPPTGDDPAYNAKLC